MTTDPGPQKDENGSSESESFEEEELQDSSDQEEDDLPDSPQQPDRFQQQIQHLNLKP
jgi:hypothetical protein